MKKGIFFTLILLTITLLSSCAHLMSSKYELDLDENNAMNNKATIVFDSNTKNGWFAMKEWNGIDIKEGLYNGKNANYDDVITLTVPAGQNSFLFDITYTRSNGNSIYSDIYENIEMQYVLAPGRTYLVRGKAEIIFLVLFSEIISYSLEIYDTTEKSELLKEWVIWEKK